MLSLNEKLSEVQLLRLRATFQALPLFYFICELEFYARTHTGNYATLEINHCGQQKQAKTKFYFGFLTFDMIPWNSTSGGFTCMRQSKWKGIIAIKTERTQIHFFFYRRSRCRRVFWPLSPFCWIPGLIPFTIYRPENYLHVDNYANLSFV